MNNSSQLKIGKRVREARKDANLTQRELGIKIGKSKQWISELERGNIRLTYENAVKISYLYGENTGFFSNECP